MTDLPKFDSWLVKSIESLTEYMDVCAGVEKDSMSSMPTMACPGLVHLYGGHKANHHFCVCSSSGT
eukprot:12379321-Karenia_brevis.AAC.1